MTTEESSVILFDIPGSGKDKSWSLNMMRIRYVLNYKSIPHTTRWLEFHEIKPLFLELGIPPSGKDDIGEDKYTCPSIKFNPGDGKPPIYVTDSFKIAEFLDEQYPDPPLYPNNTKEEQRGLATKARTDLFLPIAPVLVRGSFAYINEASKPYFRFTRERSFGMKIEEFCPDDAKLQSFRSTARSKFTQFLREAPLVGPYVCGQELTYIDFVIASTLQWMKIVAEPELWSQVKDWDNGTWEKILDSVEGKGLGKVH